MQAARSPNRDSPACQARSDRATNWDERTVASNQEMSGDLQAGNRAEAFVTSRVESIAEESLDLRPTELPGRQADPVDDDQIDVAPRRPGIEIGGRHTTGIVEPVPGRIEAQHPVIPGSDRTIVCEPEMRRRQSRGPISFQMRRAIDRPCSSCDEVRYSATDSRNSGPIAKSLAADTPYQAYAST